jgi:hypothetical protein
MHDAIMHDHAKIEVKKCKKKQKKANQPMNRYGLWIQMNRTSDLITT